MLQAHLGDTRSALAETGQVFQGPGYRSASDDASSSRKGWRKSGSLGVSGGPCAPDVTLSRRRAPGLIQGAPHH